LDSDPPQFAKALAYPLPSRKRDWLVLMTPGFRANRYGSS